MRTSYIYNSSPESYRYVAEPVDEGLARLNVVETV
jgi:hypothetical protein